MTKKENRTTGHPFKIIILHLRFNFLCLTTKPFSLTNLISFFCYTLRKQMLYSRGSYIHRFSDTQDMQHWAIIQTWPLTGVHSLRFIRRQMQTMQLHYSKKKVIEMEILMSFQSTWWTERGALNACERISLQISYMMLLLKQLHFPLCPCGGPPTWKRRKAWKY